MKTAVLEPAKSWVLVPITKILRMFEPPHGRQSQYCITLEPAVVVVAVVVVVVVVVRQAWLVQSLLMERRFNAGLLK